MRFCFLLMVVSIFYFDCLAQKKKGFANDDFLKEMIYENYKQIFQEAKLTTSTQKSYVFPWKKTLDMDKTACERAMDTVAANFVLEREENDLKITSSFPANFKVEGNLFSLTILKYDLKNEKGDSVELGTNINFINFGNKFSSSFSIDSDGNSTSSNTNTVTFSRAVALKTDAEKIEGEIIVESRLITGYDFVKVTSADVGKEISFSNVKLKLVSINKNVAVFKLLEGNSELDYLITGPDDKPYNGGVAKIKIAQQDYDYFKANPKITLKDFTPYYEANKNRMLSKDAVKDLLVFVGEGEIVNFYMYFPVDSLGKESRLKVLL